MAERQFPILLAHRRRGEWSRRTTVPWSFLEPHEAQAQYNHGGQSLARLAERGGLGPSEMLAIVKGIYWSDTKNISDEAAIDEIELLIERKEPDHE